MNDDLTIIMLTPNLIPTGWAAYHRDKLLEAANGAQVITISREPLDWGINLIQTEYGFTNIFRQMLRGAETATTPFIAMADDDTLYPHQHFSWRPQDGQEGYFYNLNRWHLFTWGDAFYFHKPKPGNGLMICQRELLVQALKSRFRRFPDELPGPYSHEMGVRGKALRHDKFQWQGFYTSQPVVSFYHEQSLDEANRKRRKYAWPVRAYDIPVWGHAENLRKLWA